MRGLRGAVAASSVLLALPLASARGASGVEGVPEAASFESQVSAVGQEALEMLEKKDGGRAASRIPTPAAAADADDAPSPGDLIQPEGLPALGKWMLDSAGKTADWLGDRFQGKRLAEPIDVILRVDTSDPEIAREKLLKAARAAGFRDKYGHTSHYQAWLAGTLAREYPSRGAHAFSDHAFLLPNDHGRLFGPVLWRGQAYFLGAFSREDVSISMLPRPSFRHPYESFVASRERFVKRMTSARFLGYVALENAISPSDPKYTTGDHDGRAALLELR